MARRRRPVAPARRAARRRRPGRSTRPSRRGSGSGALRRCRARAAGRRARPAWRARVRHRLSTIVASHGRSRSSRIRRGVVARQGPVRADEGVLGGLLGGAPVAQHAQGDREAAVLVREDERLEGAVEVAGEIGQQAAIVVHRSPEPRRALDRCISHPRPGRTSPCITSTQRPPIRTRSTHAGRLSTRGSRRLGRPRSKPWPTRQARSPSVAGDEVGEEPGRRGGRAPGRRVLPGPVERREHARLPVERRFVGRDLARVAVDRVGAVERAGGGAIGPAGRRPVAARRVCAARPPGTAARPRSPGARAGATSMSSVRERQAARRPWRAGDHAPSRERLRRGQLRPDDLPVLLEQGDRDQPGRLLEPDARAEVATLPPGEASEREGRPARSGGRRTGPPPPA